MRLLAAFFALCLPLCQAAAMQEGRPITFQKERLILYPTKLDNPAYAQGVLLEIEVREASMPQKDWLELLTYKDGTGLLEISDTNAPITINAKNRRAPVDVIAINHTGDVVMIAPSLVLADLEAPIQRAEMARAILYTTAGLSEMIGLQVGDDVAYRLFKKPPTVLDENSAASQPAPTEENQEEENNNPIEKTNINQAKPAPDENNIAPTPPQEKPVRRRPIANPISSPSPPPTQPTNAPPKMGQPDNRLSDELVDELLKRHPK